jgi:hypothetical protein
MDWIQRLLALGQKAPYQDQSPPPEDDRVTTKDLLKFMERQSQQQNELIRAVLENSASQSRTLETYIDLFKPRNVPSSTLEQREQAQAQEVKIRKSEWEGIESMEDFNRMTAGPIGMGIPPDLE